MQHALDGGCQRRGISRYCADFTVGIRSTEDEAYIYSRFYHRIARHYTMPNYCSKTLLLKRNSGQFRLIMAKIPV